VSSLLERRVLLGCCAVYPLVSYVTPGAPVVRRVLSVGIGGLPRFLVACVTNFAPDFPSNLVLLFILKVCKVRVVATSGLFLVHESPGVRGRLPRATDAGEGHEQDFAVVMTGKLSEQSMRATATSIRKPATTLTTECANTKNVSPRARLWRMQHAQGCSEESSRRTVAIHQSANKLSGGS
jgi:hypothetical protein